MDAAFDQRLQDSGERLQTQFDAIRIKDKRDFEAPLSKEKEERLKEKKELEAA